MLDFVVPVAPVHLLGVCAAVLQVGSAGDRSPDEVEFRREFPIAASEIHEVYRDIALELALEKEYPDGWFDMYSVRYLAAPDGMRWEVEQLFGENPAVNITVLTPARDMKLAAVEGRTSLVAVGPHVPVEALPPTDRDAIVRKFRPIGLVDGYPPFSFAELLERGELVVEGVASSGRGKDRRVTVAWMHDRGPYPLPDALGEEQKRSVREDGLLVRGETVFLAGDGWVAERGWWGWVSSPRGTKHYSTLRYSGRQNGVPILSGADYWAEDRGSTEKIEHEKWIVERLDHKVTPRDFTLAAFDIPESAAGEFAEPAGRWGVPWLAAGGVLAVLAGLWLWRRRAAQA